MSSGQYLIVAGGCNAKQTKTGYNTSVTQKLGAESERGFAPCQFNVPDGTLAPKFGSFDTLIRLTDDLQKYDSQVESVLRRVERQLLDIDEKVSFEVSSQNQKMTAESYLKKWQWDDARFPRQRGVQDNLQFLLTVVNKLDEEGRAKSAQYNEIKTSRTNLQKKSEGASLMTKDLVDVLTPDKVRGGTGADADFIMTENLTTVLVILSKGGEGEFLKEYEKLGQNVVPMSAKKFQGLDDKDGNSIWRVVVFKNGEEAFKRAARDKRYTVRDFEYSADAYKKQQEQLKALDAEFASQQSSLTGYCKAAWSDIMIAWMHIKALRVLTEATLRYGMSATFAAFIVCPQASRTTQMRKALGEVFSATTGTADRLAAAAADGEAEEFHPYISLSFSPFAPKAL